MKGFSPGQGRGATAICRLPSPAPLPGRPAPLPTTQNLRETCQAPREKVSLPSDRIGGREGPPLSSVGTTVQGSAEWLWPHDP